MIYVYSGKTLVSGYPKTLESLGLPKNFKAAFHRPDEGKGGKTYFMKGDKVWRYDEAKERLDSAYPKLINGVFPGLRSDPSGAFHDGEGIFNFFYVIYEFDFFSNFPFIISFYIWSEIPLKIDNRNWFMDPHLKKKIKTDDRSFELY